MTDTLKEAVFALLEPAAEAYDLFDMNDRAALSQAISLKRIADALEKLASEPRLTSMADGSVELVVTGGGGSGIQERGTRPREQTVTKGWVVWSGGNCPVSLDTVVEYRMRSGGERTALAADIHWKHLNSAGDIVAYRLAKQ